MFDVPYPSLIVTYTTGVSQLRISYAVFNAHAPYYVAFSGVSGCSSIFPHYFINGMIFEGGKRVMGYKICVLILSTAFV